MTSAPDLPRYAEEFAEEIEDLAGQRSVEEDPRLDRQPERFIDRESSMLDFQARVLALAEDDTTPLLERVKFLAIVAGNLDEFFMVRVAGLQRRIATGLAKPSPAGLSPREQLSLVARKAHDLAGRHARCWSESVLPALARQGIEIVRVADLHKHERAEIDELYADRVYPVLTPLAVDPAHPFPYISGLSLNLAVVVHDPETGKEHFARVKVPPSLPRFVAVGPKRFVLLEDVIETHLDQLFPGVDILECTPFRVTRNEDVAVEEEEVENLLQALERELVRRRFGPAVRLEVADTMSERVLDLLVRELGIGREELYMVSGMLDLAGLWSIVDLDLPALKYPPFIATTAPSLRPPAAGEPVDVFATLRAGDVLVHHPYESFTTSVQAFVEAAAADPNVLAIKQTLYRTSGDSPIVNALIEAANAGKQVLVVVEIKARFDEQANIKWARALEQSGCHVVYGLVGLKTHCKLALVVRQEADGTLRRYAHIGTGNYNPKTARQYEDLGLLTADEEIGSDIADLFNHLSGFTRHRDYRTLLVAPDALRPGLLERIEREAKHARAGRPAGIAMKLNAMVDEQIIDALYDASQDGVPVTLVVRGMCALRPGVPGLSESIRVRSILGRYLEHSRVFRFCNGGDEEIWIGSADAMHRNLDRRVEALVRIDDERARARLRELLDLASGRHVTAWTLDADGEWHREPAEDDGIDGITDYQELLIARARAAAEVRTEPASA